MLDGAVPVADAVDVVAFDAALVTVAVTVFELPQPATAIAAVSAAISSAVPRVLGTRIGVCSAKATRILPASCDDPRHDG